MIKRFLGIDYGAARIGLALGDNQTLVARPFKIIDGGKEPLSQIQTLIHNQEITGIVVGLPRGLDGQETAQTTAARNFADRLKAICTEVYLQDEAATTIAVQNMGGSKRQRAKRFVDAEAAALILQDFLNDLRAAR